MIQTHIEREREKGAELQLLLGSHNGSESLKTGEVGMWKQQGDALQHLA